MKKKLFMLIGGSVLSAFMLAGCNNDAEPPPEEDNVNIDNPVDVNDDRDNGKNRINNLDRDNDRGNNRINNNYRDNHDNIIDENKRNNRANNKINDVNRDKDFDSARDRNTNRQDIIEDRDDMRDRDNKDR